MHLVFFHRLFLIICGSFIVYGADFTITCPPRFINGLQYSLLCQVNRRTVNKATCNIVNVVQFFLGKESLLDASQYSICNTSFGTSIARCVNTTQDQATYELLFTADYATQQGQSLRCWSDCLRHASLTANYTTCTPVTIIEKPPARHNCSKYVYEGQNLTCNCDGGIDTPPGVFRWAGSMSDTLTVITVQRSRNGTRYPCQAVWNGTTVESEVIYTLSVVYGPDNVSATTLDPLDINGVGEATLTCSASEINPSPIFTWTRQGSSDVIHQGQSYMLSSLRPTDDGSVFHCQAQNTVSNVTRSANVTIHLNYPPNTDPVIASNSTDLYQGDTVTFNCTVNEGKPVGATSVNLTCAEKQSTWDIVGSSVISSVTFAPLLDSDHNSQCACNTRWKQTNWYTRTVNKALYVIAPPSTPHIVTSADYPPIAGVTTDVTLICVSSLSGRPAANYTWPVTQGLGQPGVNSGQGTLTFTTFRREDNGKNVTCRASNLYTINRQPVADCNLTLNIYYTPVITQDSACLLNKSTCTVTEGEKVLIQCKADSNPAPETFTWRKDGGTNDQNPGGPDLNIAAADHTIHNGKYICTVTTGKLDNGHQPLTSSQQLAVLVKYKPAKLHLTVNTHKNITVNEEQDVGFACLADGRPTPYMELRNNSGIIKQLHNGEVLLEDRDTWLNHTLTAQCHDAGVYRCAAMNSVGEGTTDAAMVYVNCAPRAAEPLPKEPPTLNFLGQAVQLSLHLVAYPLPYNFSFSYYGPADNSSNWKAVVDNILQISCWPADVVYIVTCNVTVNNITSTDKAGLYSVTVANDFGDVELNFTITVFKDPENTPILRGPWAAVGGGISGAAAVIVVAVVVVFFIKRHRQGSNQHGRGLLLRKTDGRTHREPEMNLNSIYASEIDKNEDETMIVNNLYGTPEGTAAHQNQTGTPQRSDYEDVSLPPAAKPQVKTKPQIAAKMSTANDEKDTYSSVVQKGSKPVGNPADTAEYASVDKTKTTSVSGQNAEAAVRTGTTARNKSKVIQKPAKKPKPAKNIFNGKAPKEKKEDEHKLRKRPEHTEGAVYGNMLLSMNPVDCKVYENYAFQNEESETKPQDPNGQPTDQRSANMDGLVYTTIQFTESQQKKAEHDPPKRETTEYVSIVFNKSPSSTSDD